MTCSYRSSEVNIRVTKRLLAGVGLLLVLAGVSILLSGQQPPSQPQTYDDLVRLYREWREFQKPKVVDGVPDYSPAAMRTQREGLKQFQQRLAAIDIRGWTVPQKVDYNLVRAEMNGTDFDHRVLRPWSREPSFYVAINSADSDVPLHEGPQVYGALEMWKYSLRLSEKDATEVRAKLDAVPSLLEQAKRNLTEDTRDLWTVGIVRKTRESRYLVGLQRRLSGPHPDLAPYAERAKAAVDEFRGWLEQRQKTMKGSSAIGVENYNWYLKNVHLVPYTWQQELEIEQREMERALATLQLEEQHNRNLPPFQTPANGEEMARRSNEAVDTFGIS